MGADPVVGAHRRFRVRHADVDVLAADRGPQHSLQGVLDQRVAPGLMHRGLAGCRVRVHARTHDPGARVEQLPAQVAKLGDRLARVRRHLRARLEHRLEQLSVYLTRLGLRVAQGLWPSIEQLVVLADYKQLLLDPERERRLAPEVAFPETLGCLPEPHSADPPCRVLRRSGVARSLRVVLGRCVGVGVDPRRVLFVRTGGLAVAFGRAGSLLGLGGLAACPCRLLVGGSGLPVGGQPSRGRLLPMRGGDLTPVLVLSGPAAAKGGNDQRDHDHDPDHDQDDGECAHLDSFRLRVALAASVSRDAAHVCCQRSLPGSGTDQASPGGAGVQPARSTSAPSPSAAAQ